jgi:FAD/FMN-containing dehydrogenase
MNTSLDAHGDMLAKHGIDRDKLNQMNDYLREIDDFWTYHSHDPHF